MTDRIALRKDIRARRRAISPDTARRSAASMADHARHHPLLLNSRNIAGFLSSDGEMNPLPLMYHLWSLGKRIYLPVLVPFNDRHLWFSRFEPGDELVYNRYGIPEPVKRDFIKPSSLDLVLTPLVAFDLQGNRVGMGGGYYDRRFAFLNRRRHWRKPRLLGIAYELQKQERLHPNAWDIPLHGVATERALYMASAPEQD